MSDTGTERSAGPLLELVRAVAVELRPELAGRVISLETSLERELGLDSMARAELMSRIERRFGVTLPDSLLGTAETPLDLLEALASGGPRPGAVTFAPEAAALVPPQAPGGGIPARVGTLVDALEWHAVSHPDRVHLVLLDEGDEPVTYGELLQEARAFAGGLWEAGMKPGDRVGLMLPTGRDYFRAFLGVWLAGGIPVPIYPPSRPSHVEEHLRRQAGILGNAGASILVTGEEARALASVLEGALRRSLAIATPDRLERGPAARAISKPRPGDIALLQYTSGSTGNPKGVVLTHGQILANIRAMGTAIAAGPADIFVSWLPLYHDMGLIGAWLGSLYFGMRLAIMSPLSFLSRPSRWLRAISDFRATLSAAPNFAYELCVSRIPDEDLEGLDLSSWRLALNGAEPVSPSTIARFAERFERYGFRPEAMAPVYGLAEAAVGLAFPPVPRQPIVDRIQREPFMKQGLALPVRPDDPTSIAFVSCGRPLPGYRIRVVDPSGRELEPRKVGRIEFRGPSATSGYFGNPDQTRKLRHDGWVDTGDLGYMADGELFVTGRVKDIIIKAGRNIVPQELEEAVGALPGIRKGCVAAFASPDPATGTERVVLVAETHLTEARRLQELREQILGLAIDLLGVPLDDVVLAPPRTIPKTSSGKIRRSDCRALYEQGLFWPIERGRPGPLRLPTFALGSRLAVLAAITTASRWLRAGLRRLAEAIYAAYAWTVFSLVAVPVWAIQWTLPRTAARRRLASTALRAFFRLVGIRVAGIDLDRIRAAGPCVVVANHFSYLDGPLLAACLGTDVDFVATGMLLRERFKRPLLRRLGVRFVSPDDPRAGVRSVDELAQVVAGGRSIVVFPEGNLAAQPGLRAFHMGAFVVAARAHVPVVPVAIRGSRAVLRPYSWMPRPGEVVLRALEPIRPEPGGPEWQVAIRLRDQARAAILPHCGEPAVEEPGEPLPGGHSPGERPEGWD